MKEVDFIIIGQGLAGSCMAHRLIKEGKKVMVFDEANHSSASLISSGILNPITGRRYVKSWMFDYLLPEALSFYNEIGIVLNSELIKPLKILRALKNVLEENIWSSQSAKPDYKEYFGEIKNQKEYISQFTNEVIFGEVNHSYQVDLATFVLQTRKWLISQDSFTPEKVDFFQIAFGNNIKLNSIKATKIIFAEGWQVINNPFFKNLPFDPTKGEVFIAKLDNYKLNEAVKNKKFVIPYGDDFWVGSTNENKVYDDVSNPIKQKELENFLEETVKSDYHIKEKWTAVRPSTKQRRPVIGRHPQHHNVYLFNGLGTKGASLAPYFSKMLTSCILDQKPIIDEVNIELKGI